MRVLLITRSINEVLGGLEKQILSIAEGLANLDNEISIVSLDSGKVKSFYFNKGHSGIHWIGLGIGNPNQTASLGQKVTRQLALLRLIRDIKPDVAVAFMIGALMYSRLPTLIARVPLILAERNSPDIYTLTSAKRLRYLYFTLMIGTRKITIQLPEYVSKYPWFLRRKLVPIPNSIVTPRFKKRRLNNRPTFVYGGRFSFQKRLDLLILSFSKYKQAGGRGELLLFGNGEQESTLRDLIERLGTPLISINPPARDISDVFERADFNCLLSIWEGFPNFLAEGLEAGIPAIGIKGCDGVTQLIEDGVNGWLASDASVDEIARVMMTVEGISEAEYLNFSRAASNSVQSYRPDKIMKSWERLLKESARA